MNNVSKKVSHSISLNALGAARAEVDFEMLRIAFVETPEYSALKNTRHFNYVVGRRGTGKTALFLRLLQDYKDTPHSMVMVEKPQEYEIMAFHSLLIQATNDYRFLRSIARIVWRTHILFSILRELSRHWKIGKCQSHAFLFQFESENKKLLEIDGIARCNAIFKAVFSPNSDFQALPGLIAAKFNIEKLQEAIEEAIDTLNSQAIILFDGLDEGWLPKVTNTAIIGGLAIAIADLADRVSNMHGVMFVRDNMFRALSYLDPDSSRHLEGSTLRLRWDESSLLRLVAARLRACFSLESVESDIKVWNRHAQNELKDRDGLNRCLKYTLFRPRDILVLLNEAFLSAARSGREVIVGDDIEASAEKISHARFDDLIKEYESVFPGLDLLANALQGSNAFETSGEILAALDRAISTQEYKERKASDFAVLGTASQIFLALYSVGFLGVKDPTTNAFMFCHDGSRFALNEMTGSELTVIHPCFWKALNIYAENADEVVLSEIYDDYRNVPNEAVQDMRTKMLGQIISALPTLPLGDDGYRDFEDWCFRTIKILFPGSLSNPELKPNQDSVQRRDIVATNLAQSGFWKRIYDDYKSRQVVFEVKNYADLRVDDFRQALSYSGREYGKFIVLITRSESEGLGTRERSWVKEYWDQHDTLIFLVPAPILVRCVGKMRNAKRHNYTEDALNKRLDTFQRSYLSLRSSRNK